MYRIHNTGDWRRTDTGSTRDAPTITEHDTLDTMHPFDRAQFVWMLEHGEIVTQSGATVWQITRGK